VLLTMQERFTIMSVLPQEGNLATVRILRDLASALAPSEADHSRLGLHVTDNRYQWNVEADLPQEVAVGLRAYQLIRDAFESLDKGGRLTLGHLPVYERFVEEPKGV
jgi:hypothetical protein